METDVRAMMAGCEVVLALQPPGFDPPCAAGRPRVRGRDRGPRRLAPLDPGLAARLAERGDPWVLLSLSTTTQRGQRETLQAALDGLATMPVRVLVTLGGDASASQLEVPANAVVSGFVPHELVLPHMSAVVTHAGMSTIAVTLAAGVPMVCVPRDATRAATPSGSRRSGPAWSPRPGTSRMRSGVLLADGSYRAAAERIARACVPLGGGARATDLVEALAFAAGGGSCALGAFSARPVRALRRAPGAARRAAARLDLVGAEHRVARDEPEYVIGDHGAEPRSFAGHGPLMLGLTGQRWIGAAEREPDCCQLRCDVRRRRRCTAPPTSPRGRPDPLEGGALVVARRQGSSGSTA